MCTPVCDHRECTFFQVQEEWQMHRTLRNVQNLEADKHTSPPVLRKLNP